MQSGTAKTKIDYIDNLRILMTVLVVLHHTLISYGAPGGWYFTDATTNHPALMVMTMLVAINQSFFMGFFFFLSAYFTEPSYAKKGALRFTGDRLKRLGIPLLFYSFLLSPVMNFLVYKYGLHKEASFLQYLGGYDDWIDFGVLWFVAALLVFTFVYVLLKQVIKNQPDNITPFPTNTKLFLFAIALGMISYVVRIFFPIGWILRPLGFQLAYFPQYISLFFFGIVAFRNQWMNNISYRTGKKWLAIALVLVIVVLPLTLTFLNGGFDKIMGKGTWQSFVVAVWEQLTGISIMVALSGIAKYRWNYKTPLSGGMSRAAFATYIFHPLIIISATLLLLSWQVDPAIKLLIAAPCTISFSFALGWLITKLPVAKKIV